MSIVLLGATSGSVTLQEPAVAGTTVIDLPATSGTMAVTSGSPSFTNITATGTLAVNGNTTLGDATTDTLTVGVTGIVKDASGNVGIGTTTPDIYSQGGRMFTVSNTTASGYAYATLAGGSGGGGEIDFGNQTVRHAAIASINGSFLAFYTNSTNSGAGVTQRMTIDTKGDLLIGASGEYASIEARCLVQPTSTTGSTLFVNTYSNTGTAVRFYSNISGAPNAAGTITLSTATAAYNTSSDYRLKENIQPMVNALATVAQLKPVTYKWKVDGSDGQGFIAHELQAFVPDAVTGEKDAVDASGNPEYQGVDTSFLVATLTAAIQEQQALITQLQADVAALKGA